MQVSRTILGLGALAGVTFLSPALADPGPWYVGAGVGETSYGIPSGDHAFPDPAIIHGSTHTDSSATGWRLDAGYRFSRYFAVEGLYADFGSASSSLTSTAPANHFSGRTKISGEGAGAVGFLPLTDQLDLFGRVGLFHYKSDVNVGVATTTSFPPGPPFTFSFPDVSTSGTTQYLGAGVDYALGRGFKLRAAWDYFRAKDGRVLVPPYYVQEMVGVHLLSLELLYSF